MAGPSVLSQGAMDFKGSDAKMSIVIGAMAVSDLIKSTLGPKGMVSQLDEQQQQQHSTWRHVRREPPVIIHVFFLFTRGRFLCAQTFMRCFSSQERA
jgi:hypothetical protein